MRAIASGLVLLLPLLGCEDRTGRHGDVGAPPIVEVSSAADAGQRRRPEETIDVGMVALLANPGAFDRQRVRVIGYVNLEFEGNAVYLHKEDFDQAISQNALWISVAGMARDGGPSGQLGYSIVEGVFRAGERGHMGMFGGAITDLTRLERWPGASMRRGAAP